MPVPNPDWATSLLGPLKSAGYNPASDSTDNTDLSLPSLSSLATYVFLALEKIYEEDG